MKCENYNTYVGAIGESFRFVLDIYFAVILKRYADDFHTEDVYTRSYDDDLERY